MLEAEAWPYPVFNSVACRLTDAKFGDVPLEIEKTSKGYVVSGSQLRERYRGTISLQLEISTPQLEVTNVTFGSLPPPRIACGARVLCQESKFRAFVQAGAEQQVNLVVPLEKLRGVAEINAVFVCDENATTADGTTIEKGSIVGFAQKPIFLTVDENWTGETIPVDWLDFASKQLPAESFVHVELSGGSQVPKVWLNAKYKNQLEAILSRKGDASAAGLAGAALRELIWASVWGTVVVWSLKEESSEHPEWPSSRIAKFWRGQFDDAGFQLALPEPIDTDLLNEIGLRVQHCLRTAQNPTRINDILRFQPDRST